MASNHSRRVYQARMHQVLQYIDAHIEEPLNLAQLARVAAFSPHHFHRLFSAWHGERLGDYLRRRRLELAATRLLAQPSLTILEVALGVGFGSAEAFTRAFRDHFGQPPSVWRRASVAARQQPGNPGQANRKLGQMRGGPSGQDANSSEEPKEFAMTVRLQTLDPVLVAYLRYTGPYGWPINAFWRDTFEPWLEQNGLAGRPRYGISHDDQSITAADRCRYDACVEIDPGTVLSGGAQTLQLPGGRYAILDFQGSPAEIGEAWATLLRDWLPGSELQLDGRPCFEYYPADEHENAETRQFTCQICVPVASL